MYLGLLGLRSTFTSRLELKLRRRETHSAQAVDCLLLVLACRLESRSLHFHSRVGRYGGHNLDDVSNSVSSVILIEKK